MSSTVKKLQNGIVEKYVRSVEFISTVMGVISALMILSSVIIICQMIWVRFIIGDSTIWQTEAVTYLMISATLIGLPYVQLLKGHVNVDLVPMLLSANYRKWLAVFVLLMTMLVIGVMAFHGYELFHIALERNWTSDTVWGVRLWIPYLALPVGLAVFLAQMLADILAVILTDTNLKRTK